MKCALRHVNIIAVSPRITKKYNYFKVRTVRLSAILQLEPRASSGGVVEPGLG